MTPALAPGSSKGSSVVEEQLDFPCRRGYNLNVLLVRPRSATPLQGVLLWHHGFGEHCLRHIRTLRELAEQLHMLVVTYDAHGHGKSGPHRLPLRAYVHSWRYLVDDMFDILDKVVIPNAEQLGAPTDKLFAAGHSMGGLVALLASLQRPGQFRGVMLSSPLISVTPKNSYGEWAQIAALRILNLLIPRRPFLKRRSVETGIRDPQSVKEVLADNMWYRGPVKVRTVVSLINGTLALQRRAHQLRLPIYLQQGTLDRTCSVLCARRLLPCLGSNDVTYHEVEGGFHDLLHDPETPKCVQRMAAWLEAHM